MIMENDPLKHYVNYCVVLVCCINNALLIMLAQQTLTWHAQKQAFTELSYFELGQDESEVACADDKVRVTTRAVYSFTLKYRL